MLTLLCLCLSGCGMVIHQPRNLYVVNSKKVRNQNLSNVQNFEAIGKVGFSNGKQGGNARVVWQQHPENYQIRLYGPLASGAVQIKGHRQQVSLTATDGKIITAKSPEALVQTELGWVIPVSALRYWLRGLAAPSSTPLKILLDEEDRLWEITQEGWIISYQAYKTVDGIDVPYKLLLKNGSIRLKFIFDHWKLSKI